MKKNWIVSGIVLLVLLGLAGLLLFQSNIAPKAALAQEQSGNPKAEKVIEIAVERNINGKTTAGTVQVRFEDPEELPEGGESAIGVFLGQKGDFITLGTGSIEVTADEEVVNDEEPVRTVKVSHSGDPVEIMVTPDTKIYADITAQPEINDADLAAGSKVVMCTIVPGSLEAIGEGMILRVWGTTQDGMVIADVLVYESIE